MHPQFSVPGNACVSRAWRARLAIADFLNDAALISGAPISQVRFGGTPKPGRETRALPEIDFLRA